jgi:hypothetical protein
LEHVCWWDDKKNCFPTIKGKRGFLDRSASREELQAQFPVEIILAGLLSLLF